MTVAPQIIRIIVPADLKRSSLVRHAAEEIFASAGFDKTWSNRLKLVTDELFMNAALYGSAENSGLVYLAFEVNNTGVHVRIEDDGSGSEAMSPEDLMAKIAANGQNTDTSKTSGRGLSMITKAWTDDMAVGRSEHGGLAVTIFKAYPLATETTGETPMVSVTATAKKNTFVVPLSGEIDQANISQTAALINERVESTPQNGELVLDFSGVNYINSSFIGHLVAWQTHLQKKGGRLVLRHLNHAVRDVLDLVGLLAILKCE